MYNDQRRGDSWKLNDLRTLLFMHYARESCHSSTAEAPVRKASRLAIVAARLLPSLIALGGVIVFSLVSAVCYAIHTMRLSEYADVDPTAQAWGQVLVNALFRDLARYPWRPTQKVQQRECISAGNPPKPNKHEATPSK